MKKLIVFMLSIVLLGSCNNGIEDVSLFTRKKFYEATGGSVKNPNQWLELKSDKTFVLEDKNEGELVSGKYKISEPEINEWGFSGKNQTSWEITFYDYSGFRASYWSDKMTILKTPYPEFKITGSRDFGGFSLQFKR